MNSENLTELKINPTEPIFAIILAFFIIGELPAALSFGAIFITLIGVMLTWKKKPKHKQLVTD
ncbi:MAG TPA: hypothetical protein VFM80_06015 [Gracilimonas sp.]|uniref:hypothetical protein n=1 Tax=Gracilimonas sp. TaxID=1974203 RepID=UPI002D8E05DF|nr:hypothetical protein [Gracilimonas sp.]